MPVLDSNLLIRLAKEDPEAIRALRRIDREPLIVPFQTALEYATGTKDPEQALADIASSFILERPERATLEQAAKLAAAARRGTQRILSGDAWIAACAALRSDYVVTTNKRDFQRLGVTAWNYEQEQTPPTS